MPTPRKLLVFDLDETLVHAAATPFAHPADFVIGDYSVYVRPHASEMIALLAAHYDFGVWSSASKAYVEEVSGRLFESRFPLKFVWSVERCIQRVDVASNGYVYIKDLRKLQGLGYGLDQITVLDDSPEKISRQPRNHLRISPWVGAQDDHALADMAQLLLARCQTAMHDFTFTPITRADFPLLSQWLQTPHVARWWADDPSPAAIEADYGGCVDGTEPAAVFIAHYDGQPVGLIQRYRFGAYPEYIAEMAHIMPIPEDVTSIDYLIGPGDQLGRGLGGRMIAAFVDATWRADPGTSSMIVPVHADNRASWRALEQAGFHRMVQGDLTPDNPADSRAHVIYRLERR
jgi:aminoglycoside 6'-N-acetyltransferase